ncbi:MAG: hypothetical protein IJS00_00100 [Paludibacteraceae bacterium]|nr:hypothetical protein [Paludibacteraceae bacterium]
MKKVIFLLLSAIALLSCHNSQKTKDIEVTNPIMPIHYTGGEMQIVLTDYLPWLSQEELLLITSDEDHYMVLDIAEDGSSITLTGDNTLSCLTLSNQQQQWDIPIVPHLPNQQALISTAATSNTVDITLRDTTAITPQLIALVQDQRLSDNHITCHEDGRSWTIHLTNTIKGRSFLRVYAATTDKIYNDILIPLNNGQPIRHTAELSRHDDQAQVLYSILIDRFANGNKENDWKMNSPEVLDIVDYQGGDIAGITRKINEGYFDQLGITTLWISPITQNPWDAWGYYPFQPAQDSGLYINKYDPTKAYTRFSGYHGYWPIYATAIDKRLGTGEELTQMLATAHRHNMNVVLDYVANHMHIASPTLQAHPDWHTDSILPDGRRNFELWDDARLTTWFDKHIPTLDLEREDVYMPMTDSALYWLENYDFDGFRHDACKHIPECYWRTLTHKAVTRFPNRHIWMIGETYGSPELIGTYVKTGMLNAQFDFNVYFTAQSALSGIISMATIDQVVRESLSAYGAHHTMGNISGNHDQARITSVTGGAIQSDEDTKEAGWTREVGFGSKEKALRSAIALEVLNMTLPGIPCIYQGDEIAETGGNDPDNRHPMRFEQLTEEETQFKQKVQQLIQIRRNNMALLYGDYIPLQADANKLTFMRVYLGETIFVSIDRNEGCTILDNENNTIWSEQ